MLSLVMWLVASCSVGDGADHFSGQNSCGAAVSVEVQESAVDLEESDHLVRLEPGATDFVVMTTVDPESVIVRTVNDESGRRIEFEIPAGQFVETGPGEFTLVLEADRCP